MPRKKKERTVGNFKSLDVNITAPLPMDHQSLTLNNLTVLVGQNSSGKSFMLKNTFAMSFIQMGIAEGQREVNPLIEFAQYVYDGTFSDQNITGEITGHFVNDKAKITINFEEGKVINLAYSGFEKINKPIPARFMSSEMRLFTEIHRYCKTRQLIQKANPEYDRDHMLLAMLAEYKLYDVNHVEHLLHKVPYTIPEKLIKTLKEEYNIRDNIKEFHYDPEKCDFFFTMSGEGEKPRYLTTYGSGDQSICNIMITNYP